MAAIMDGCYFGECSLLLIDPVTGRYFRRTASAHAARLTTTYAITREKLHKCLEDAVDTHHHLKKVAKARMLRRYQHQREKMPWWKGWVSEFESKEEWGADAEDCKTEMWQLLEDEEMAAAEGFETIYEQDNSEDMTLVQKALFQLSRPIKLIRRRMRKAKKQIDAELKHEEFHDEAKELLDLLLAWLRRSDVLLWELMAAIDVNRDNKVSMVEFSAGLKRLGCSLDEQEQRTLFKLLDRDVSNYIDARELNYAVMKRWNQRMEMRKADQLQASPREEEWDTLTGTIKVIIDKLGKGEAISDWARSLDKNADGNIDLNELVEGMQKLELHLPRAHLQLLLQHLDKQNVGAVNWHQLYDFLTRTRQFAVLTKQMKATAEDAMNKLLDELRKRHEMVSEMLARLDKNNDGSLDHIELERGLKKMGIRLEKEEFQALIEEFDKDGSGEIDFVEFKAVLNKQRKLRANLAKAGQPQAEFYVSS
jgi:Ca2+-binding EF-hand superfamily protein